MAWAEKGRAPLVAAAGLAAAGVAVGELFPRPVLALPVWVLPALGVGLLVFWLQGQSCYTPRPVCLFLLMAVAGLWRWQGVVGSLVRVYSAIEEGGLEGRGCYLEGTVVGEVKEVILGDWNAIQTMVRVEKIQGVGEGGALATTTCGRGKERDAVWQVLARQRAQVTLFRERVGPESKRGFSAGSSLPPAAAVLLSLAPGCRFQMQGRLLLPPRSRNPGEPSRRRFLATQGAAFQVTLEQVASLPSGGVTWWRLAPLRLALAGKEAVRGQWARALNPESRAVLAGLVFGEKEGLPPAVADAFRVTGVLHLLAVSGLHVGFIYCLLALLVSRWAAPGIKEGIILAGLGLYALATGAQAPVKRAALMCAVNLLGKGRRAGEGGGPDSLNSLGLAALVLLLQNPLLLGDVGFQLTLVATLALLLIAPVLRAYLPEKPSGFWTLLAFSLAAQAATAPLVARTFNRISWLGPVGNLVLVPPVGLAVQLGLAGGLVGILVPPLGFCLNLANGLLLGLISRLARWLALLPGGESLTSSPSWPWLLAYYVLLAYLTLILGRAAQWPEGLAGVRAAEARRRAWRQVGLALGVLLLVQGSCGLFTRLRARYGLLPARVVFLDVGQGDSAVIHTPDGKTVVIDGGPKERTLVDYLTRQGCRRVEAVVLSHAHDDHLVGLLPLLTSWRVEKVYASGILGTSPAAQAWAALMAEIREPPQERSLLRRLALSLGLFKRRSAARGDVTKEEPCLTPRRGERIRVGKYLQIVFYREPHPPPGDLNASSLVCQLQLGKTRWFFPGDLPGRILRRMPLSSAADALTVLKAPHHGAADGLDGILLAQLQPDLVVLSVGARNRFGHPSPKTLAACRGRAPLRRTDREGAILVRVRDRELEVKSYLAEGGSWPW